MIQGSVDFPWLGPSDYFTFPDPRRAEAEGVVAVGGNLSPGMLLSAYRQGIFPWFSDDDPVIWWSPDPRFVLFVNDLHIPRSLGAVLRRGTFRFTLDRAFAQVIHSCATVPRAGQSGTWITQDMELAYRRLHELGYAHSVDVWRADRLVGGLYGLCVGRMFFGESMFSLVPDASKAALVVLVRVLESEGCDIIDAQQRTPHIERMGGRHISRAEFLSLLGKRVDDRGPHGLWRDRSLPPGLFPPPHPGAPAAQ